MTPGLYLGLSIGLRLFLITSCVSIANMSRHVREADEVEASHKPIFRPLGLDGLAIKAKPRLCFCLSHVQDLGLAPRTDS